MNCHRLLPALALAGGLLSFTLCPYVILNQERTKEICAYAFYKQIGVLLINSCGAGNNNAESYVAMQHYTAEQDYAWDYVFDDNPSDPTAVTRQNLHVAIQEMLAGRPVSLPYSPTESCPIPQHGD